MSTGFTNPMVSITYIVVGVRLDPDHAYGYTAAAGGSGQVRVRLSEIVDWLASHPGNLIVSMRYDR